MVKLIATDLDGTLADMETGFVPWREVCDTISEFKLEFGAKWTINTGRDIDYVIDLLEGESLAVWPDYLCLVERYIYKVNKRKIEEHHVWNSPTVAYLARFYEHVERLKQSAFDSVAEHFDAEAFASEHSPICVTAKSQQEASEIVTHLEGLLAGVHKDLLVQQNHIWVRVVPRSLDKGVLLREIQNTEGIEATETLAIGDGLNDGPMLVPGVAGMAGAPENCHVEISKLIHTHPKGMLSAHRFGYGAVDILNHFLRSESVVTSV